MGRKKANAPGGKAAAGDADEDTETKTVPSLPAASTDLAALAGNAFETAQLIRAFADPTVAAQVSSNPLLSQLWRHVTAANQATVQPPGIHVDVQELAEHFGLDERITKRLDDEIKKRPDTMEEDLQSLYDILETARSPAGLLAVKIKEMQEGTFITLSRIDPDIKEFKDKFELDDQAVRRLVEAKVIRKATWEQDKVFLHTHLETSNRPAARIMMMLGKLRSGEPLGEPDKRIAPGSYADRMERQRSREKRRNEEERGRDRDRDRRDRSRDRDRRDRDRRDRRNDSRDRSRDRRR